MLKKRFRLFAIIIIVFVIIVSLGLWYSVGSKAEQPLLTESPVTSFSDDSYTLLFAKDSAGPQFEIYSVKSNGTDLTKVKSESSGVWQESAFSKGIVESMGKYYGDFDNPSRNKKLDIKSRWFGFFTATRLYLVENNQRRLLTKLRVDELEWLRDGRRIVFSTGNKIGIIDTESMHFGYLTDGAGWIVVQ